MSGGVRGGAGDGPAYSICAPAMFLAERSRDSTGSNATTKANHITARTAKAVLRAALQNSLAHYYRLAIMSDTMLTPVIPFSNIGIIDNLSGNTPA